MTEADYIKASNLAKVRAATAILRECMRGDVWGIDPKKFNSIMDGLYDIGLEITDSVQIDPDE